MTTTSSGSRRRRAGPGRRGSRSQVRSRTRRAAARRRSRSRGRRARPPRSGAWMCCTIQASAPSSCARAQQVDHPLERPPRGPDALDRGDLGLDGQDRLDLQRRAEPRLRAGDPAAAAQVLERVDREPHLQLRARLARVVGDARRRRRPAARRGGRCQQHQSLAAAGGRRVDHVTRASARSPSCSRACSAARTVPDMPPARWIETISWPASSSGS